MLSIPIFKEKDTLKSVLDALLIALSIMQQSLGPGGGGGGHYFHYMTDHSISLICIDMTLQ